jgi:uncharacterized protein (TIGR02453 family)
MSDFNGFPKEAFEFLKDLQHNNNREWFNEHKQVYIASFQEPAIDFVSVLGPRLKNISPTMQYISTASRGSIMRIYRDIGFSKDKTPYKDHLGINFWDGPFPKTENPGYFLHIEENGAYLYGGNWRFNKAMLHAYRAAIAHQDLGADIGKAIATIRKVDQFEVDGDRYKRFPRGFDEDHPMADLMLYKGLWSRSPHLSINELSSPNLVDQCEQYGQTMAPLHHALLKVQKYIE